MLKWRNPTYQTSGLQIAELCAAQSIIGWKNFLYGRLSPKWEQHHALIIPSDNNYKSKRWVTQLIRKLWNTAWDLWEHRNGILHDKNHPWKIEENRQTALEIQEQFKLGSDGLAGKDKCRLWQPVGEILTLPPDTQKQWLLSIKAARHQFEASKIQDEAPNPVVTNMRASLATWLRES